MNRHQPGYYPGFETLMQQKFWDATTRDVVLERVNKVPSIRFFTPEEARLLEAICDRVIPQDDRDAARRIPIVPRIDERLFLNHLDGYRFEDMPPDQEAYRMGIQAIDQIAGHLHQHGFLELAPLEQDLILKSLHDGKPAAAQETWKKVPVPRFWTLLVQACAELTTPTHGPGMKSASAAPHIRAVICVWSAASPSRGKWRRSGTNESRPSPRLPMFMNLRPEWKVTHPLKDREEPIESAPRRRVRTAARQAAHAWLYPEDHNSYAPL